MWQKGGSGRENVSAFQDYFLAHNDDDGPEDDIGPRQAEPAIQEKISPQTSVVCFRPTEAAVHLVVRPD